MEPGVALHSYIPAMTGEMLATATSLMTAIAALFLRARRTATVRRSKYTRISRNPLPLESPGKGLLLSGTYRGRAVEMGFVDGVTLRICARLTHSRVIPEEARAGQPLPEVPWLSDFGRRLRLSVLPHPWSLCVAERSLLLCVPCSGEDPERMRCLLDLACDLGESLDAVPVLGQLGSMRVAANRPGC